MKNIEILHQVDMEIVKEVVRICDEHNLIYYMHGGTMLGAIRHKGFIPWDDDIDMGMPRDDYEKFLKIAENQLPETYKVVNYRNTPQYQYYITRVLDTDTKLIEERIGNDSKYTHASIDIFPIDGSPNNTLLRKIFYFRVLAHRALMSLCYKDSIDRNRKRGKVEKVFLWIMERLPIEKLTTPYKQKCKIDKILRSQDVAKSKYVGSIMGAYRTREMIPAEYYGKGDYFQFENMKLRGLEDYNAYLTHLYGDYMQLPPEDKRKTHFKIIEIHGEKVAEE